MSRAALYHRVSTLDQDASLARRELQQGAKARGFEIVLDIEESGSGARNDRPGLRRVLTAARKGEIDAVLVWKLDRWGRSALDVLHNIRTLQDAGVRFVAVTQGLDVKPSGDAMSQLLLTILSAVAEFERSLLAERTHLGLDKARRAGKRLGRPRSAQAPLPAEVRRLRAEGRSWRETAAQLGCSVGQARRAAARDAARLVEKGGHE